MAKSDKGVKGKAGDAVPQPKPSILETTFPVWVEEVPGKDAGKAEKADTSTGACYVKFRRKPV